MELIVGTRLYESGVGRVDDIEGICHGYTSSYGSDGTYCGIDFAGANKRKLGSF
jgi:hypothetical protein